MCNWKKFGVLAVLPFLGLMGCGSEPVFCGFVPGGGGFGFCWDLPGGGQSVAPNNNSAPAPMPISTGGFTINGVLFPGGVFNWSGGNATFCFTDVFHCSPGATSATGQVNGPGAWNDNQNPGPVIAHESLSCGNLCFTWLPPGSGRYIVIIQDNTGYAQVWVLVIVLANNPNPPEPPVDNLVATITDVDPPGGTFAINANVPQVFRVTVEITNGDGRELLVQCLPYTTVGNGTSIKRSFSATNGAHTIDVPIHLSRVTTLGNNSFWIFDDETQISQGRTVSITVN